MDTRALVESLLAAKLHLSPQIAGDAIYYVANTTGGRLSIPTLLLLGTADTQTAISWGQHAAETLENSQVVIFPETGHGAINYSQCAKDIGAAFVNNPEGKLVTSCTVDLVPQFVLPPE